MNRLFERDADGLLHEVEADKAEEARRQRRVSTVVIGALDVLWTADEEAARDAEEAAEAERKAADAEKAKADHAEAEQRRAALKERLGLSEEDLAILKG